MLHQRQKVLAMVGLISFLRPIICHFSHTDQSWPAMAFPDAKGSRQPEASPNVKASSWAPFQHRIFTMLWVATVVSNVGGWMFSASSSWLMMSLDAKPLTVSLVQAANALPLFLFAVPAGALADIIDKRRFIIVLEILITIVSAIFAALVSADLVSPATLLGGRQRCIRRRS